MKSTKPLHAAGAGEVVFLAGALVHQADAHAVVQEAQLAQALAQDLVVEVGVLLEDLGVGQEVHLGAALVGVADDLHRRHLDAVRPVSTMRFCTKPRLNSSTCTLPSRRTVRRSILLSALTQLTPTPCRPPETL